MVKLLIGASLAIFALEEPATTLFFMGPQKREWGFLVNNKWIHNEKYLKDKSGKNI